MKVIAVDPKKTYEHIYGDESDPNETVFILKPLTQAELAQIQDTEARQQGTRTTLALKFGLKDWRGVTDAEGNDIPFPTEGSVAATEMLPTMVKYAVHLRIMAGKPAPKEPESDPKTGSPPKSEDG